LSGFTVMPQTGSIAMTTLALTEVPVNKRVWRATTRCMAIARAGGERDQRTNQNATYEPIMPGPDRCIDSERREAHATQKHHPHREHCHHQTTHHSHRVSPVDIFTFAGGNAPLPRSYAGRPPGLQIGRCSRACNADYDQPETPSAATCPTPVFARSPTT
jgi:hypothetical protein